MSTNDNVNRVGLRRLMRGVSADDKEEMGVHHARARSTN